jgi:hypothetical protein
MLQQLSERLGGIPVRGLVILGVLVIVQLGLQVFALIDLVRRAQVLGGSKWLWAAIIVLGQLLGPIAYLVAGRRADTMVDVPRPTGGTRDRVQRALDTLYDKKDSR